MSSLPRRAASRLLTAAAGLAVALGASLTLVAPPASADQVTPGDFTGYGFDQCLAPTQQAMDRWLNYSPFLAVGIYISGDSRGCRNQPNLTPAWVASQLGKGWRLLPITLGPQASCNPSFPRYRDDTTIIPRPGTDKSYAAARKQGRAEAASAVEAAQALGIDAGSTLWYDLEGFDVTQTRCRESALSFLSGWTWSLHQQGFVSGVYSSAGSGIKMLDDARVLRPDAFNLPDRIWIARWDGVADTSTSYIRADGWLPGNRMKQFQGGHDEVWGGVRINIDRDWLDLGKGSVAAPETHCGGVPVTFKTYPPLTTGTTATSRVKALQCLLQERKAFTGNLNGTYGPRLVEAVHAWQTAHGMTVSDYWSRKNWMSLLADGTRPVAKFGSAGPQVRRIQRALNASTLASLTVTGTYDAATVAAVRTWQARVDASVTGVLSGRQWLTLQAGDR
ncbi:MAG: DUF1906 domain-containing protein [Nocardioidaceae bacterium]